MQRRKALILQAPGEAILQQEPLQELKPGQVLIRSLLSTFKHGTEMSAYHGSSPFLKKRLDPQWRVFLENREGMECDFYPRPLGNMTVGVLEEVGEEVRSLSVGDAVFGWLPVADWHVSSAEKVQPLDTLTPMEALVIDPAIFALGAVLDGDVRFHEKVFITGLGAIGLLAIQYCKLRGATVYAASSFPLRRQLAKNYGAEVVLDTREVDDLGLGIKRLTDGGVDVALECSGSYSELHQAIRATRQCGRVVCVGFYSGAATDLRLGEEFFHNRITLLASLPALRWNNPVRSMPLLYSDDLQRLVIDDLKRKRLKIDGLLLPTYSLSDSPNAVEAISARPQDVIKAVITY
jgi:threonine dehydrogenase-like Zn-dependent dehydrogenase